MPKKFNSIFCNIQVLLEHGISFQYSKQFTVENKYNNKVHFWDILFTHTKGGHNTCPQQKSTYLGLYMNFVFNHAFCVNNLLVHCLQHSLIKAVISSNLMKLKEELKDISSTHQSSNYLSWDVFMVRNSNTTDYVATENFVDGRKITKDS